MNGIAPKAEESACWSHTDLWRVLRGPFGLPEDEGRGGGARTCGALRSPTPAAVSGVTHFWRRVQAKALLAESGSAQRSRAFGASDGRVAQGLRSIAIDPKGTSKHGKLAIAKLSRFEQRAMPTGDHYRAGTSGRSAVESY